MSELVIPEGHSGYVFFNKACVSACRHPQLSVGDRWFDMDGISDADGELLGMAPQMAEEIKRLRVENERLRVFTQSVKQWADGYPEKIFTEPSPEQIKQVCDDSGFPLDRISAMVLRQFTKPWGELAEKALVLSPDGPNDPDYPDMMEEGDR